ncbi:MAG: hypothetical protein IJ408_04920 [Clostridia bacterium]|nr:hypothetical protein [Clostridia bacterium]
MKGTYIFRYYLPCEPTYPKEVTQKRADALLEYCEKAGIDAVMLYVDLDPNWYYMPDSLEHTKYYVPIVEGLGRRLEQKGISYQLNYQNLFGSWDGGSDLRHVNNWENFVDEEGLESWGVACSIGEKFRSIAGEKLSRWAATKPDVLWIDDDIRMSHHRASVRELWTGKIPAERMDFGCFCDKHIELFNKKVGKKYTREEIRDGILSGNKLRREWLEFQGECANELCSWISDTVLSVSPDTKVAIMTSNPDTHSTEGRHWKEFLTNISGGKKPMLRPTFGPYVEKTSKLYFNSYARYEQLKADLRATYGTDVDFCPEIENTRFTRWAKSIAGTGYQLSLGAFLGSQNITLSIFDLDGCVLDEEPEFCELLTERKPFFDKMVSFGLWDFESEGVGLITAPDRVKDMTHSVGNLKKLCLSRYWEEVLMLAGIPCKYIIPDDFEKTESAVIDSYTVHLLRDDEIKILLSKKVLLDSVAAKVLCERGFGEYLGVKVGDKIPCIGGKEIFDTLTHTDGSMVQAPLRIEGGKWRELIPGGSKVLTRIVTPAGDKHPGFVCFENSLGGKVYVFAADGGTGDGFYSNFRIKLLKEICSELSGTVNVKNQSFATACVKSKGNTQFIFTAPLAADCQKDVVIELQKAPKSASYFDIYGNERTAEISGNTIICKGASLHTYECIVCKIEY